MPSTESRKRTTSGPSTTTPGFSPNSGKFRIVPSAFLTVKAQSVELQSGNSWKRRLKKPRSIMAWSTSGADITSTRPGVSLVRAISGALSLPATQPANRLGLCAGNCGLDTRANNGAKDSQTVLRPDARGRADLAVMESRVLERTDRYQPQSLRHIVTETGYVTSFGTENNESALRRMLH